MPAWAAARRPDSPQGASGPDHGATWPSLGAQGWGCQRMAQGWGSLSIQHRSGRSGAAAGRAPGAPCHPQPCAGGSGRPRCRWCLRVAAAVHLPRRPAPAAPASCLGAATWGIPAGGCLGCWARGKSHSLRAGSGRSCPGTTPGGAAEANLSERGERGVREGCVVPSLDAHWRVSARNSISRNSLHLLSSSNCHTFQLPSRMAPLHVAASHAPRGWAVPTWGPILNPPAAFPWQVPHILTGFRAAPHPTFFFLKELFIYWLERQSNRGKEREIPYLLVHLPDGPSGQGCVSCVGSRSPKHLGCQPLSPRHISKQLKSTG